MTPREDIDALSAFTGRVAGSDAERRAARHLATRLGEIGREAIVEPLSVFPAWHLTYALHALLAIGGSLLAVEAPVAGAAVLFVVLVSLVGDATGTFHLLRRLTGRRASQNVVSTEEGGKPGTLVLLAHYDAARTGAVYSRRLPFPPSAPLFGSVLLLLICVGLRVADVDGTGLTAVQFVPTVVLIVYLPLLVDIALSQPVPGANDNASGVATALGLAGRLGGRLEHFDLWLVLTGAQESFALGMRDFLRSRRGELGRASTVFVNMEEIGSGQVGWARRSHRQLRELCEDIAEDDPDAEAHAVTLRSPTDAAAAAARGYPAITICCRPAPDHHLETDVPERVEDEALERAAAFCSELAERIDQELGPQLAREADEPVERGGVG